MLSSSQLLLECTSLLDLSKSLDGDLVRAP